MTPRLTHHLLAALLGIAGTAELSAQGTAFTYQGRLTESGSPANGLYDLQCTIYNAPVNGSVVAGPLTNSAAHVAEGLFTVALDFGSAVFDGGDRWLEIAVRSYGSNGTFTALAPRQPITSTPYALRAASSLAAVTANGVALGAITESMLASGLSSNLARLTGTQNFSGPLGLMTDDPLAQLHVAGGRPFFDMRFVTGLTDDEDGFNRLNGAAFVTGTDSIVLVAAEFESAISILDASDPAHPRLLSELVDGVGVFTNLNGVAHIELAGNLAYASSRFDDAVTLLDISNPSNPQLAGQALDQSVDPASPFSHLAGVRAVAVGGSVAVAVSEFGAVTFMDVSNPAQPQLLAEVLNQTLDTNSVFRFLERPVSVAVRDSLAFVVSGVFSPASGSLTIIDFSDPSNPQLVSQIADDTLDPGSPFTKLGDATDVVLAGAVAIIGAPGDHALTFVDVSDPADPTLLEVLEDNVGGFNALRSPGQMFVDGSILYVPDRDCCVSAIDVSDPAQPKLVQRVASDSGFPPLSGANSVYVQHGIGFVSLSISSRDLVVFSTGGNAGLLVEERLGVGTATPRTDLDVAGGIHSETADVDGLATSGSLSIFGSNPDLETRSGAALDVAGGSFLPRFDPLFIDDVVDEQSGMTNLAGPVRVGAFGTRLYIPSPIDHALTVVVMTGLSEPNLRGTAVDDSVDPNSGFTRLRGANDVFARGSTIYVTGEDGLTIARAISTPQMRSEIFDGDGQFNLLAGANSVVVSGTNAFVTSGGDSSLTIIDVSDETQPRLQAEIADDSVLPGSLFVNLGGANSVDIVSGIAYVTAFDDSALTLVDVSDPRHPQLLSFVVDDSRDPASPFTRLAHPRSVTVRAGIAYVTSEAEGTLTIIDVSDPANPTLLGMATDDSVEPGSPFTSLAGAFDVEILSSLSVGTFAMVSASTDDAVSFIDVSDPAQPDPAGVVRNGDLPFSHLSGAAGMFLSGNRLYVAGFSADAVTGMQLSFPRFGLQADGWVGLGTETPRSALDVTGDVMAGGLTLEGGRFRALDEDGQLRMDLTGAGLRVTGASPGTIGGGQLRVEGSETTGAALTGAGVQFMGHDGNQDQELGSIRSLKANGNVGSASSFMSFHTRPDSGPLQEQMRITSTGRVGIGTVAPRTTLHVQGQTLLGRENVSLALPPNVLSLAIGRNGSGNRNGISWVENGNAGMKLGYDGLGFSPNSALRIYGHHDEPLVTFEESGSVGIGVTNPAARLQVADLFRADYGLVGASPVSVPLPRNALTLAIGRNEAGDQNGISWVENGNAAMKLGYDGFGFSPDSALRIYGHFDEPLVAFEDSGNVGIGVTNPAARLQVADLLKADRTLVGTSNVALASPQNVLSLAIGRSGDARVNGISWIEGGNAAMKLGYDGFGFSPNSALRIYGHFNEPLVAFEDSGNVGIGVTNPAARLQVEGTVAATAFVGNGSGLTGIPDGHSLDASDGSPANAVYADASGHVGIGTTVPQQQLHVQDGKAGLAPNANSTLVVERDHSTFINVLTPDGVQSGVLFGHPANGNAAGGVIYNSSATPNGFQFRVNGNSTKVAIAASGNLGLGNTSPDHPIHHSSGAVLSKEGIWKNASDRNRKTGFEPVDRGKVLEKLAALPVQQWRYRTEPDTVRHLGPTAQDFRTAFGLGTGDRTIGTLDADGVALAAIQGLNEKLEREVKQKDAEIAELRRRLAQLEQVIRAANLRPTRVPPW